MIKQLIVDGKMTDILFNSKESMDGLLGWVKDNINYFLAKVYISNNDDLVFKVKKDTINIICNDIKVEIKVHEVLLKKGNEECMNDYTTDDRLFREAAEIVVTAQQCYGALLMKKFKLGYNGSASLIEILEAVGIVGGFQASIHRQVLIPDLLALDQLLEKRDFKVVKDSGGRLVGRIEIKSDGKQEIRDSGGRLKGYYDPKSNQTKDSGGRFVGSGNLLTTLL